MRTVLRNPLRSVLAGSLVLSGAMTAAVIGGAQAASAASVIRTISVGASPDAVSSDGTHVWVSNANDSTVSELNAFTGSVIQTISLPGSPTGGISSDGTHVWVATNQGVSELSASTGSVIQTTYTFAPDGISSDGSHVWTTNNVFESIGELDASTGSVIQYIPASGGAYPDAVSSDGTRVWVTNSGAGTVSELSASTGSVIQTIPVGAYPDAVSAKGTQVWVANYSDNNVSELDALSGSVIRTVPAGYQPTSISSDGTDVWVVGDDNVTELSASTGSIIQTISRVGIGTHGISSDGNHVWVANYYDNTVDEINPIGNVPFEITTSSLPSATPGASYGPVTLQETGAGTSTPPDYTTIKWKKVSLPKGLKLRSDGVLSGTLNKKLPASLSSVTVQVTETVTTLNGKKKVETKTTVQATIPITIT